MVLVQSDGKLHPIAYASRRKDYSVIKLETLGNVTFSLLLVRSQSQSLHWPHCSQSGTGCTKGTSQVVDESVRKGWWRSSNCFSSYNKSAHTLPSKWFQTDSTSLCGLNWWVAKGTWLLFFYSLLNIPSSFAKEQQKYKMLNEIIKLKKDGTIPSNGCNLISDWEWDVVPEWPETSPAPTR